MTPLPAQIAVEFADIWYSKVPDTLYKQYPITYMYMALANCYDVHSRIAQYITLSDPHPATALKLGGIVYTCD